MINPPKPPEKPKPTKAQFRHQFREQSEDDLREFIRQQEHQLELETKIKSEQEELVGSLESKTEKTCFSVDVNPSIYSESVFDRSVIKD